MTTDGILAVVSCGMAVANSVGTVIIWFRYFSLFRGVISLCPGRWEGKCHRL
ncbi:MAG: hypothetical protein LUQ07_07540 [Methanospirillum sp.]|nr:hypothetical protein [Methanospirillum sp.]